MDEHDLAKALDSVAAELDAKKTSLTTKSTAPASTPVVDEPIVLPGSPVAPVDSTPAALAAPLEEAPAPEPVTVEPAPVFESAPEPTPVSTLPTPTEPSSVLSIGGADLDDIKQSALVELKPLVGKLDVSAEEKFDTYLLLLRSTDDSALVAPAHEAAKAIEDEARRAEALLEIIKEIDYLSKKN